MKTVCWLPAAGTVCPATQFSVAAAANRDGKFSCSSRFGMERFPPCSQSCPGWDCDDLGRVRSRAGCRAATAVTFGDGCGAAGRCAGPGSGSAPHHRPATARPPLPLAFGEIWSRPGWWQTSHSLQSPRPVPPTRHAHQTQMLPSNSISFLADRKSA